MPGGATPFSPGLAADSGPARGTTGFVLTYDADPPATVSRFDTQLRSAIGVKF